MAMQSASVATTTFKIVKKGYDPDEVRAYLKEVAGELRQAQEHAASVESRARQAIARAKDEAAQQIQAAAAAPARSTPLDDTDTISRTLLLAQKTADETVAAAVAEADAVRAAALAESESLLTEARDEVARAADTARLEARRAGESERQKVESELQQLLARLEFLRDDVTQMEAHTAHQRERLLQVADELHTIASRPTAGLGDSRRPVLSAAADLDADAMTATQPVPVVTTDGRIDDPTGELEEADRPAPDSDDEALDRAADTLPEPDSGPSAQDERPPSTPAPPTARLFEPSSPPSTDHLDITAEVPIVE